jgi:GMC oxidoreductase
MSEHCDLIIFASVAGVAHKAGTCRFGTDPDPWCSTSAARRHELDDLYVVDRTPDRTARFVSFDGQPDNNRHHSSRRST